MRVRFKTKQTALLNFYLFSYTWNKSSFNPWKTRTCFSNINQDYYWAKRFKNQTVRKNPHLKRRSFFITFVNRDELYWAKWFKNQTVLSETIQKEKFHSFKNLGNQSFSLKKNIFCYQSRGILMRVKFAMKLTALLNFNIFSCTWYKSSFNPWKTRTCFQI